MTKRDAIKYLHVWKICQRDEYFGLFTKEAKYAILVNTHRLATMADELRMLAIAHEQQAKEFITLHFGTEGVDENLFETDEVYRNNVLDLDEVFINDNPLLDNWLDESIDYTIYKMSLSDLSMLDPADEVWLREEFPEIFNDLIV